MRQKPVQAEAMSMNMNMNIKTDRHAGNAITMLNEDMSLQIMRRLK